MGTLKVIAVGLAVGYMAVVMVLWLAQERLMFHPRPLSGAPRPPPGWTAETVQFTAADGTRLAGVLVRPFVARGPAVIYYGGNAEETTEYAALAHDTYGARAALFVNYRGYGGSEGVASERALVADALALYDWAARRPDVDPSRIALHGRSLGTGVAVQVAAARPARCVVLTSPFASARDLAAEIYPWLPVRYIMRHPFDSLARASKIRAPALFLVGDADNLIPPRHSDRLADAWGGPVERLRFAGFGHNDLQIDPRYDASIQAFLDRCL